MLKHLGSMGSLAVLLLATVLYNVLFVATVSVAAVWPKNYVRTVDLDANVGVAPSVYGILPYPGAESGQGRVPAWVIALLMVGAKVLFNSAKMLKMGVLVVLMHNYRDQETKRDVKQLFYP